MRCLQAAGRVTQPDMPSASGETAHFRALETLYGSAPINRLFRSTLSIPEAGRSIIDFDVDESQFHAAGAVHGTVYFKMLDDAAFYAANSLVSDRFLLTTAFNLLFTRPIGPGRIRAEGRWILLDFGDVIAHVFHEEDRMYYSLERLWKDCPAIPLELPVAGAAE